MLTRSGNRDALSRDCASVHTLKTVLCLWNPPKADERRTCVQCFRLCCLSCNLRVEHPQRQYNATLHLFEQTTSGQGLGVCGLNILAEAPPSLWDGRFALDSELRTLQPWPCSEEVNIDDTLVAEDECGIIVTSFLGTLWTTVFDGSFQSLQVVSDPSLQGVSHALAGSTVSSHGMLLLTRSAPYNSLLLEEYVRALIRT